MSCDYQPSAAKRQFFAAIKAGDRTKQLQKLRTPTLVLHGTHDYLLPKEHAVTTARIIPNARLEIMEGVGHTMPEKLGDRVGRIVSDFVSSVTT